MKYAYLFEARGIQKFLFSTGRLKDMLEGSELIDYICADNGLLDEALNSLGLADKVSSPRKAGGAFYLVFDEKLQAQRFQRAWRLLMSQWLPSLEKVDVISQAETAKSAVSQGIHQLAKQRNLIEVKLPSASPITERSPRTGQAVVMRDKYGKRGIESLDQATAILRNFKRPQESQSLTSRFLGRPADIDIQSLHFPNNFESSSKDTNRFPLGKRGLVGLIHADGNGLGEILRLLNEACQDASDEVYIDLYRTFSEGMNQATVKAANKATHQVLLPAVNEKGVMPARPLVLGGDDVSLIVKADLAIDFTKAFLEAFKQSSKEELAELKQKFINNGLETSARKLPEYLTACAGIVFMKSSQPFYQAYEVAEGLCKQAKVYSRQYIQATEDSSASIIPASLAFYKINDSLIEEVDMMVETSMSVSSPTATYHLSLPAYMVDEVSLNSSDVPSLSQLQQLNLILSDSRINARPLRQLATLMHLNIDQAKQVYKRWLQYSKRSTEQLQKVSKAEQREVKQINLFLSSLEQVIGDLENDLPVTKVKNPQSAHTEYQSVIGDLLTLITVAEEGAANCVQSRAQNEEGA